MLNHTSFSLLPSPSSSLSRVADDVLRQGVRGISDIITVPGLVNVDFADVKVRGRRFVL